ncbi:MAG: serine protease, partial [Chloroflexota bacterium]|nr:serine protease [Chloroflexota bacterium]
WSGVMIDSEGLILSTSKQLDYAPLADYVTASGRPGQAWVIGRDDGLDIALYQVIGGESNFDAVPISGADAPQTDTGVIVLGYPAAANSPLDRREERVLGLRTDLNSGARYIQIQSDVVAGTEGGGVFDNSGGLAGLRMTEEQLIEIGLGRPGEAYAVAASSLRDFIVPQLQGGVMVVTATLPLGSGTQFPSLPNVFTGNVTVNGAPAQAGVFPLYARLTKQGLPDVWVRTTIGQGGVFQIAISAPDSYGGGRVEFWGNRLRAAGRETYTAGGFFLVPVDLTFSG